MIGLWGTLTQPQVGHSGNGLKSPGSGIGQGSETCGVRIDQVARRAPLSTSRLASDQAGTRGAHSRGVFVR